MNRLELPLDLQSLAEIRQWGCYFVDKTPLIWKMVTGPRKYCFLSRPRRFGKSMLVDTLHELFQGNRFLFEGLDIEDKWDWSESYPVIRIIFDGKYTEVGDLERNILTQLSLIEESAGLAPALPDESGPDRLLGLLTRLHRTTRKPVVVLVDEYDAPLLQVIDRPDMVRINQEYLHSFFNILKGRNPLIRFVFVTGVSMFSGVSLFSGFNNLRDLSLDPEFATLCGYTDHDIETVFAPELPGLDREMIRTWYNGYYWLGEKTLYNPYDVLLLFKTRRFESHWYRTGRTTYLFRLMEKCQFNLLQIEGLCMNKEELSKADVGDVRIEALLFQSGYLTILKEEVCESNILYHMHYPNLEVRKALNLEWLSRFGKTATDTHMQGSQLIRCLATHDFDGFDQAVRAFFARIPHQSFRRNQFVYHEAWYVSMLNACFHGLGVDYRVEESTYHGQSDMVVEYAGQVFVFEFKVVKGQNGQKAAEEAIAQMRGRGYADKYRQHDTSVTLLGLVFSTKERNLISLKAESA